MGIFKIKFMHPSVGGRRFVFPEKDDTCWVRESDILLSPQIVPVEEEGTQFQKNLSPRLKRLILCGREL